MIPLTHTRSLCSRSAWVNNCVGHFNHRYFVLFLLYLFLVCAYGAIMSYTPFMESHRFAVVSYPPPSIHPYSSRRVAFVSGFNLCRRLTRTRTRDTMISRGLDSRREARSC
jgi:hypothetical protein